MSLEIWKGIFSHSNIAPGLWHVSEDYYVSGNRANIWVVVGQPSLVVDAGLGIHNLLGYLRDAELVGEDVVVIATHCHFDHSGGLHHFPQVWVHGNESKSVTEGDQQASVSWLSDEEVAVLPRLGWTATEYRVERAQVTRELQDGEVVFGMKVLHLPGHSTGSIALLCTSRQEQSGVVWSIAVTTGPGCSLAMCCTVVALLTGYLLLLSMTIGSPCPRY